MYLQIQNWQIKNMEALLDWLLTAPDGDYVIKKRVNNRTNQQNRYLRGWVYKAIADSIGEDVDYVHWVMGQKFLLDRSKKAPYVKSTANLNTTEFTIYVDNIRNWVAQYGIVIPDPDQFENYTDDDFTY